MYIMCDGGRITVMKMRKIILSAASAAVSAAFLAASASAYITEPDSPEACVAPSNQSWKITINASYSVDYTSVGSIRFVTKVTDIDAYNSDVASGFYAGTETTVLELQGSIALGANDWFQYDFSSISKADGDSDSAARVTPYSDGTVELYGDLSGKEITNEAQAWTTMSINEWGNTSSEYSLTLLSAELFDTNGEFIIGFDANGRALDSSVAITADEAEEPAETEEETEEPVEDETEEIEETEEVVEETAAEEEEPVEETTATTEKADETTAAADEPEETTQAQNETPAAQPTAHASSASQNGSLMVILIAAGVVILGAIIGIVVVLAKRRK